MYLKNTEVEDQTIQKIEKKIWQLILLAVVIILFLTLALLGMQFLKFIGKSEVLVFSDNAYEYSVFLATLVLLFCAYMIVQQRKLLQFSKSFLREKESSYRLSKDLKTISALMDVSSSINSKRKLSEILNTITRKMLECFQADHSSIMLLNQESKMLKTVSSLGKGAEFANDALIPIGKSIAGRVVKNGNPILLNGKVDPSKFPGAQKKDRNISSALCVPLKIGNKNIGVLNVNLVDRKQTFPETDLKLITLFANSAAVAINNAALFNDRKQRIRLQTLFEQLHSPQIVRELVKKINSNEHQNKTRKRMEVSILFADIRGFSNMMNTVELEGVMEFLDEFYDLMAKIVSENKGNIDKFIGDEVMAFFGAPNTLENSVDNALNTAKEMISSFEALKKKFLKKSPHFKKLGIGIGVNTGEVFVGNVGSIKRYDYTVIGNAVNLSRRLCSDAKSGQILVSENAINKIAGMSTSVFHEDLSFKGVVEPVNVYEMAA